jgi:rRNA-processing protein FCF1
MAVDAFEESEREVQVEAAVSYCVIARLNESLAQAARDISAPANISRASLSFHAAAVTGVNG